MSKITLANLANLQNETTAVNTINANSAIIQTAMDNTLSRDGTLPNQMGAPLDMNSNRIVNLPAPISAAEPLRLGDANTLNGGGTISSLPPGGTTGQVLSKNSSTNFDTVWLTNVALAGTNVWTGTNTYNNNTTFNNTNTFNGTSNFATAAFTNASGPFLNNARQAKTTTYVVSNVNDKGATIALGGSAFYTLTMGAASGFDANFMVTIVNEDSARAKTIAINGYANFFLYPLQSITVLNQNSAWLISPRGRWKFPASFTIYVNSSTGSNTNDGLAVGSPKQTLQAAINQIQSDMDYSPTPAAVPIITILLGANDTTGCHIGNQGLPGADGGGSITIDGGGFSLQNVADTDDALHLFYGTTVYLQNLTIIPGTNHGGLNLEKGAKAFLFGGCTFGPSASGSGGGPQVQVEDGGTLEIDANYTISGGAGFHMWAHHCGTIRAPSAITVTFSANAAFLFFVFATGNGVLDFTNITINTNAKTITGTRWTSITGGEIINTGNPDTYFPGNATGTATIDNTIIGSTTPVAGNFTTLLSTSTLGFKTGAGGTVTQITTRTTGVTINKACGQITMLSAAGSATAATFTVTNSTVAATDVIHLSQASGTNLYNFLATAVGAGTFNITFFTTGGTATDAPVINFAITKGVTS